jgi:hypothetical protein
MLATTAARTPSARSSTRLKAIDFDSLMEMDVVVYSVASEQQKEGDSARKYLGALEEDGTVCPLSVWSVDPAFDSFLEFLVAEDDRPGLQGDQVLLHSLIDPTELSYGSRQVGGGMGPSNPHGEESELLYYVNQDVVQDIEFMIKPDLEIFW